MISFFQLHIEKKEEKHFFVAEFFKKIQTRKNSQNYHMQPFQYFPSGEKGFKVCNVLIFCTGFYEIYYNMQPSYCRCCTIFLDNKLMSYNGFSQPLRILIRCVRIFWILGYPGNSNIDTKILYLKISSIQIALLRSFS